MAPAIEYLVGEDILLSLDMYTAAKPRFGGMDVSEAPRGQTAFLRDVAVRPDGGFIEGERTYVPAVSAAMASQFL
ncbi:hypothetical protein [Mesorhizobium sp. STM 4661]|uniref:hypothetical protein n=1 Tax=Mesorhizobium sp. STM 4661 TaxID=1297570 RepID=UPI0002BEF684|nr:hypothetical protein [Mesorhizobium sp. STM 4661]CCV10480.1 hypothetical protein MESS4_20056 [Mesorhizobium sp. STM 4661]